MPAQPTPPKMPKKPCTHDLWRLMAYKAAQAQDHSISDLARAVGEDRLTISRWFSGERKLKSHKLAAVCDYLGLALVKKR